MNTHPVPFEGSGAAREFIARVEDFIRDELQPLAAEHGITHESGAPRAVLGQVWQRSRERGFYGATLPQSLGGAGFSVLDHVLIKEAIYATGSPLAAHVLGELSGPPRVGALARQATPDQMERFILPIARGEKAICFAITDYLDGYAKNVQGAAPHARYDLNDNRMAEKGWFA